MVGTKSVITWDQDEESSLLIPFSRIVTLKRFGEGPSPSYSALIANGQEISISAEYGDGLWDAYLAWLGEQ